MDLVNVFFSEHVYTLYNIQALQIIPNVEYLFSIIAKALIQHHKRKVVSKFELIWSIYAYIMLYIYIL